MTSPFPNAPLGIDVSNHQRTIDWERVRSANMQFAFIKATEGTYYNDPYFLRNWTEARRVGIPRGAYHYARPSRSSPDIEAAFFLASVQWAGPLETGDILILDIEDPDYQDGGPYGSAGAWTLGFCQYVEAAVKVRPLVYTGSWYTESRDFASHYDLKDYPLWLANYRSTMPPPPPPWEFLSFWQFTSSGRVYGISGDCDLNVFNGSAERIALLGKPAEVLPDPTKPEYSLGPGILAEMERRGAAAASNEHYLTPDWSEAYDSQGNRYVYVASLNRVFIHAPS